MIELDGSYIGVPGISDTAVGYAINARPRPTMIEVRRVIYWCPRHQ